MDLDKCGVVTAAAILRLGGSRFDEDCVRQPGYEPGLLAHVGHLQSSHSTY